MQLSRPARGESEAHRRLKDLSVQWARDQGYSIAKREVFFPHRRFRVDVGACAPARKVPSRKPACAISSILTAAVVFECKQVRADLCRDNSRSEVLREKAARLSSRKAALEDLLQLHLPHLANGEALFPEFDSYRLRDHAHAGYARLLQDLKRTKSALMNSTKFDRLLRYGMANLHYLVIEDGILHPTEVPLGWGLLVRRGDLLEQEQKPEWQAIGAEHQLVFLQRLALARR